MASDSDFQRKLLEGLLSDFGKQNTQQARLQQDALAALDALGAQTVKEDGIVFEGTKIVLPAQFDGNLDAAADFLHDLHAQEEEEFEFGRDFKYRPWDGAAAFDRALYRVFGTTGFGKATQSFFGPRPPKRISIAVGPNKTIQVPWGKVSMPLLDAEFTLGAMGDEEYGSLFYLSVVAPKKRRKA